MAIDMAQRPAGIQAVANALFQDFGFRKTAVALAVPDQIAVVGDLKNAARARLQHHFAQVGGKGGQ
ncbi:hypothetical protein D3C87_2026620 [compost metagenome]